MSFNVLSSGRSKSAFSTVCTFDFHFGFRDSLGLHCNSDKHGAIGSTFTQVALCIDGTSAQSLLFCSTEGAIGGTARRSFPFLLQEDPF